MNPDIQRIARRLAEDYSDGELRHQVHCDLTKALTELSALRDTQERELREQYNKLTIYYSDAVEKLQHENASLRAELSDLYSHLHTARAELAHREEVEKGLRERNGELTTRVLKWQKFGVSKAIDLRETRIRMCQLLSEEASLRSRVVELEGKLKERA